MSVNGTAWKLHVIWSNVKIGLLNRNFSQSWTEPEHIFSERAWTRSGSNSQCRDLPAAAAINCSLSVGLYHFIYLANSILANVPSFFFCCGGLVVLECAPERHGWKPGHAVTFRWKRYAKGRVLCMLGNTRWSSHPLWCASPCLLSHSLSWTWCWAAKGYRKWHPLSESQLYLALFPSKLSVKVPVI